MDHDSLQLVFGFLLWLGCAIGEHVVFEVELEREFQFCVDLVVLEGGQIEDNSLKVDDQHFW